MSPDIVAPGDTAGQERGPAGRLAGAELALDDLIRRSGRPAHEVTAAMTTLAIKGLVVRQPGGVFAARAAGKP